MGLYHKWLFTLLVKGTTKDWEGAGSIPSRDAIYFATACQPGPAHGTRVSGHPDMWDPRVRPARCVGPACQAGPARGTRVSGRPGA
jgi:hypothetical protein